MRTASNMLCGLLTRNSPEPAPKASTPQFPAAWSVATATTSFWAMNSGERYGGRSAQGGCGGGRDGDVCRVELGHGASLPAAAIRRCAPGTAGKLSLTHILLDRLRF